jgi:hypothetical protein
MIKILILLAAIAVLVFWWRRRSNPPAAPSAQNEYICPVCDETDCICHQDPEKKRGANHD